MMPRAASHLFTGHEKLRERLAQSFSFDSSTASIRQRIFVIFGMGGIGKSEVCLKFAEDHRNE